ncbi:MAG: glucose-6-phosphate isomerase, partial [Longicatena sp.]
MEEKYGKEEASKRIVATTDKARGTLKTIADNEGYETFVIPDDIGGRFSVITPVGLFPIAVAGIDVDDIMKGLAKAKEELSNPDVDKNAAYAYAVARRIMENQNKDVEMLISYEPQMAMVAEWWKQLFGESEGKEEKGNLPTSANFSTDLHSLGQFVQDGKKILYETLLLVDKPTLDLTFPSDAADIDGMNYLSGKSVDWVNKMACQGTLEAHEETGHVPNLIITMEDMSAESFGYMCYFFFKACAMTVYLLD